MKLITELNWNESEFIVERNAEGGKKTLFIEGIFMQSEIKNRNGRIYPRSVMESAVTKYLADKVDRRCAYGELNHPTGPTINGDRISHLIESLRWDGNNIIGRAKVLDTPMGMTVQKIMEGGGALGVSSRGLGSLKETNGAMYVENFHLATAADVVTDPSGPNCWVNGILSNEEFFLAGYNEETKEAIYDIKKAVVSKFTPKQIEENTLLIFERMLNEIAKRS